MMSRSDASGPQVGKQARNGETPVPVAPAAADVDQRRTFRGDLAE